MILTNQEISFKNLMVLENSISFTKKVVRRYDDKFGRTGAKIGYIINIRKPARSVSTAGQGIQLQDYIERSVPLVLNKQYQQACAFTSSDLALSLDDFTNRVTKPKIVQLANDIDAGDGAQFCDLLYADLRFARRYGRADRTALHDDTFGLDLIRNAKLLDHALEMLAA